MGAGNFIPNSYNVVDYCGYYVDNEAIYGENYWENNDPFNMDDSYQDFKDCLEYRLHKKFPSLDLVDEWKGEYFVLLENSLIQVIIADNQTSQAVYVIVPHCEYNYHNLGQRHLQSYSEALREILKELYPGNVRVRSSPWTSCAV